VGKTKRGKGSKLMAIADSHGLPVAVCTESASPAEVKLVAATMEQRFVADVPERLIGDKGYDSDGLDEQVLNQFGSEMIAPHKQNRRPGKQDPRRPAVASFQATLESGTFVRLALQLPPFGCAV